jgi:hypothetical protein
MNDDSDDSDDSDGMGGLDGIGRRALFALVRFAANSRNETVRSALTALEVAVAMEQSAILAAARQANHRFGSLLDALGLMARQQRRFRD